MAEADEMSKDDEQQRTPRLPEPDFTLPLRIRHWNTALGDTGDYEGHTAIEDAKGDQLCEWFDASDWQERVASALVNAVNASVVVSESVSSLPTPIASPSMLVSYCQNKAAREQKSEWMVAWELLRDAGAIAPPSAGRESTAWFGAMETPFADVLRGHYLSHITCNEETHQDNPVCACSAVNLGWHLSVGDAVEAWIAHVMVEFGKLTPSSASATIIPVGWKLVPEKPTDEMLDALYAENDFDSYDGMLVCWREMLSSSPQATTTNSAPDSGGAK